ncbi:MAG: GDSL-type esterase/lipase family protein [Syntrophomonadaceae bacterium]
MKRLVKIAIASAIVLAVLTAGYISYVYREKIITYFLPQHNIVQRYEETPSVPIFPGGERLPGSEGSPVEEIQPEVKGTVVFLGDSITHRWEMPEEIGGYRVINCGIDGNTTAGMLLRFNRDVIESAPERVVILGGINDLLIAFQYDMIVMELQLEKSAENIRLMTRLAKNAGIQPVLCSVLPVATNFYPSPLEINQAVQELNTSIKKIAAQEKVEYVDLWPMLTDPVSGFLRDEYATEDGIHLTYQAYNRLFNVFYQILS